MPAGNKKGSNGGGGMPAGYAVLWKTPEERVAACGSLCRHIEGGYSIASWPDADFETIDRYVKNYPEDFCPDKVAMAKRICLKFWEGLGIAGTSGKLKGFNARSWEVNMNNRAGWSQNINLEAKLKIGTAKIDEMTEEEILREYDRIAKGK